MFVVIQAFLNRFEEAFQQPSFAGSLAQYSNLPETSRDYDERSLETVQYPCTISDVAQWNLESSAVDLRVGSRFRVKSALVTSRTVQGKATPR